MFFTPFVKSLNLNDEKYKQWKFNRFSYLEFFICWIKFTMVFVFVFFLNIGCNYMYLGKCAHLFKYFPSIYLLIILCLQKYRVFFKGFSYLKVNNSLIIIWSEPKVLDPFVNSIFNKNQVVGTRVCGLDKRLLMINYFV